MTSIPRYAPQAGTWYVRLLLLEGMSVHFALAALFLFFDYITGPSIQAAITFIIPVAAAAWFAKPGHAYTLAVVQPLIRVSYPHFWGMHYLPIDLCINFFIRASVLLAVAWLFSRASSRTRALAREVDMLEDILPVCRICKRIRDAEGEWQASTHFRGSEKIALSKGRDICPDCSR